MAGMLTLERVIEELRRLGGTRLVLSSDTEPRVTGPKGEVELGFRVEHRDIITLVEGIVPAARFADLVMMEPVSFDLQLPAGELTVRVVPGPSIWRVTFAVVGDRLDPLPAALEGEARAQAGDGLLTGAGAPGRDDPAAWSEIERLVDPDAQVAGAGEESEESRGEMPAPEPGATAGWAGEVSARPSLEGALVRSRKTSEVEVLVSSVAEERSRRGDSFATGSTIQLSADDLAAVAARTVSVALGQAVDEGPEGSDASAEPGKPGEPEEPEDLDPGISRRSRITTGSFTPVQPIEIDLREEDAPPVRIDALDHLLERAFYAGATSVILRDRRLPAMGLADRMEPLPGARPEDGCLVQKILDLAASPSHVGQLDIEGFCRFVYRPGGGGGLVRCTLVRDGGSVAAWLRHIGDEHLPVQASRWLPASVRNAVPESGLVLVAGASGHGKTTTATALAALGHQASTQTLVVADPLERRLQADTVGILQRQIPEDVPSAGRALGDALRLEARLVLVDIPRPENHALELLTLAAQGRLVLCTWIAPDGASAVEALLDALPAAMSPVERARRARALRSVVTVQLVPGRDKGVQPIFEILPVNDLFLGAVAHGRMGPQTGGRDLLTLSFEASLASLRARGLI